MRSSIGPLELMIAGVVSFVLLLLTLLLFPVYTLYGDSGLCLPPPTQWGLYKFWGWFLNLVAVVISTAALSLLNKRFSIVQSPSPLLRFLLPVMLACSCLTTATLTSSTLLLLCNCMALYIIFSTYEQRNSAQEFFLTATFVAIGSMFQYAFLVMVPAYVIGGIVMKSFRLREAVAFIFGLIAPYWIAIGFGWIGFDSFHWPADIHPVGSAGLQADITFSAIATGVAAFIALVLSAYNGVRLLTRNAGLRAMHTVIIVLGIVSLTASIVDFSNFTAYFGTLMLWMVVETASFITLYSVRWPKVWLSSIILIFLIFYIIII